MIDHEKLVGRGRYVFASSGADEKSRERAGCLHQLGSVADAYAHGAFTYLLLEGMNGGAVREDQNVYLENLRNYVADHLGVRAGEQTPTFYGAGMQHASKIYIVRASQHAEIAGQIDDASAKLDDTDPVKLFLAIESLIGLLAMAENHSGVQELMAKADTRLADERVRATGVLLKTRFVLLKACPHCSEQILKLVPSLTFESLREERSEIRALVMALWQRTFTPEKIGESEWIAQMSAYEVETYGPQQMNTAGRGAR